MGAWFVRYLKYLLNCVLSIIFDRGEKCLTCENENENSYGICGQCLNKIQFCDREFFIERNKSKYTYYSTAYYTKVIMELIIQLKYKKDFNSGYALSLLMVQTINNFNINFDVLSYVPSSKKAYKIRGYNQSEYLCKTIGNIMNFKISHLLKKIKETKDQIGLSSDERWSNLENSFKVCDNRLIKGKIVLLVDDVITTGATAMNCAEILKKNGAQNVIILTAAKSKI